MDARTLQTRSPLAVLWLLVAACSAVNEGGYSFETHDRFVVVSRARSGSLVDWVVVQAWPINSSPDARFPDPRFDWGPNGARRVQVAPGQYEILGESPAIYILDGDSVVKFRLRKTDVGSLPVLTHEPKMHFAAVVEVFRRFELR